MPVRINLVLCLMLVGSCGSGGASAQMASNGRTQIGVRIDGSVHPELISDEQALRIWLIAVSEPSNASPHDLQRMKVKVAAARLNPEDTARLLAATSGFGEGRRLLEVKRAAFDRPEFISGQLQRQSYQAQKEQLYLDAKHRLDTSLSPAGSLQFTQHLFHVKQHMQISAGPQMDSMSHMQ